MAGTARPQEAGCHIGQLYQDGACYQHAATLVRDIGDRHGQATALTGPAARAAGPALPVLLSMPRRWAAPRVWLTFQGSGDCSGG